MPEKTFFLGLGGQKCGSSWMQAYLARQPGSDFGRLGEYQIWESDLGSVFAQYKVAEPSVFEMARARAKDLVGASVPKDYLRWKMQTNRPYYFEYFAKLLNRKGVFRTGDVTPSYAALPLPMLAAIKDGFEARGIAVKVMFSMRDPVARLRSHLNMQIAKGRIETDDFEAAMRQFYSSVGASARMRYDLTLDAIEQAFAPEARHIALFETLFIPEGTQSFADWAGVRVETDAGEQRVNARGPSKTGLSHDLTREIASHYRPVYEAVARRYPQIEELWGSARFALNTA